MTSRRKVMSSKESTTSSPLGLFIARPAWMLEFRWGIIIDRRSWLKGGWTKFYRQFHVLQHEWFISQNSSRLYEDSFWNWNWDFIFQLCEQGIQLTIRMVELVASRLLPGFRETTTWASELAVHCLPPHMPGKSISLKQRQMPRTSLQWWR